MGLVGLTPLLEDAQKNHYAVGAFNYTNAETAQAVAEAAVELKSPLMYITGPWEIPLLGAKMMVDIVKWVSTEIDRPVCLHLDHAAEIDLVKECIDAGFPSVMIDASRYPFEENVRLTKMVVEMAHAKGVTVEGELGAVGRVDDSTVESEGEASLTDPDQAAEFVKLTGIDALASAIGNAHGIYTQKPVLDFARLEAIREATEVPLVLHGGSGTPADQLHKAIGIGISKVNVASELGRILIDTIKKYDDERGGKAWYALALTEAKAAVMEVTKKWMRELGCAERC